MKTLRVLSLGAGVQSSTLALMIHKGEPKLIEYSVRFGDPECQVIIPRLKNDLIDILINVKNQNFLSIKYKRLFSQPISNHFPNGFKTPFPSMLENAMLNYDVD